MPFFSGERAQIHPAIRPARRRTRRCALAPILPEHQAGQRHNGEYDPEESVHLKLMGVYIE
jgi:hypothetical protein